MVNIAIKLLKSVLFERQMIDQVLYIVVSIEQLVLNKSLIK